MSKVSARAMVEAFCLDELPNYKECENEKRAQPAAEGIPMDALADGAAKLVEQGYNCLKRKAMRLIKPFPTDEVVES